ncbi:L,D-transpeptidase family protein [Notoacmeibacter ruber]|uniref:L,D-transpeptidase family protein n=1 Tax=Notoacmeibacter ruber TaxID=2670375 RepID=UPI0011C38C50
MLSKAVFRAFAILLLVAASLGLTACTDTLDKVAKAEKPLPPKLVRKIKAMGMSETSPILVRLYKEESTLEIWKQKTNGRFAFVKSYPICKYSGKLGPKFVEGDRQAPEGFYTVRPHQMNPNSQYYLAFNIGYPNEFDRAHGRTGQHLMVHGDCSSSGCYAMTDEYVGEIYAFARDAFRGGQREFQIQAFPFKMTEANMARYAGDPNLDFWRQLKEGSDFFELTGQPPAIGVCDGRYVFGRQRDGISSQGGGCPTMDQPATLSLAFAKQTVDNMGAFTKALDHAASGKTAPPKPSVNGIEEARLVSEWMKKRVRGEKVSRLPPSLDDSSRALTPEKAAEEKRRAEAARSRAAALIAAAKAGASQRSTADAEADLSTASVPAAGREPIEQRFGH